LIAAKLPSICLVVCQPQKWKEAIIHLPAKFETFFRPTFHVTCHVYFGSIEFSISNKALMIFSLFFLFFQHIRKLHKNWHSGSNGIC
jgi:hypothetical protein